MVSSPWSARSAAAAGPAFVVLVLTGNSLTESAVVEAGGGPGAEALRRFAAQQSSVAAQTGLVLELLAFVCFAVFAACVYDISRRRGAGSFAGALALVSAVTMLAVKLGSGSAHIAGLSLHTSLTADTALALEAMNGAAFVLSWLPFAVFVAAAAYALRACGLLGRVGTWVGLGIGLVGVPAALLGVLDPMTAMPVPFLLGLVWLLVVGAVLAIREPGDAAGLREALGTSEAGAATSQVPMTATPVK